MDKALVKDIIRLKLKAADALAEKLTQTTCSDIGVLKEGFLEALNEALSEYLNEKKEKKDDKVIKKVTIE